MKRTGLLVALIARIVAVKLLTTSDDIKKYEAGSGTKLEIRDINSLFSKREDAREKGRNGICTNFGKLPPTTSSLKSDYMTSISILDLNGWSICGKFHTFQFLESEQSLISVNGLVS